METMRSSRRRQLQPRHPTVQSTGTGRISKVVRSTIVLILLCIFIPDSISFRITTPKVLILKKEQFRYDDYLNSPVYRHSVRNSKTPLFGTYSFSNNKNSSGGRDSSAKGQPNGSSMSSTTATPNTLIGVTSVSGHRFSSIVLIEMIIPAEVTQQSYQNACSNLSQNMHFPGFPRGAVLPHNLVELIHGKQSIQLQAVIHIVSHHIATYAEPALRYYNYDPVIENLPRVTVSYETIASTVYQPGEPLIFTIECDVIPEPEPEPEPIIVIEEEIFEIVPRMDYNNNKNNNIRDVPVEEMLVRSDPAAWNRELIESMEAEYADLIPADASYQLKIGDACEVQMVGYKLNSDGSLGLPLPSMTKGKNVLGDRVTVLLKGGKYMPGLVEGLIGTKMGDKITLFVTFPNVCYELWYVASFFVNNSVSIDGILIIPVTHFWLFHSHVKNV